MLFAGLTLGQASEVVDYYLNNNDNYKKIPNDIKQIIEPELSRIYETAQEQLTAIFHDGLEIKTSELNDMIIGLDEQKYGMLKKTIRQNSKSDALFLEQFKSKFNLGKLTKADLMHLKMYSLIRKNEKNINRASLKYRTFELERLGVEDLIISSKCPSWSEVIKFAGGYAELGKKGISKQNYKSLFTIEKKYDKILFFEDNEIILTSRYFGKPEAYDYFNVDSIPNKKIGEVSISPITYQTLQRKKEATIVFNAEKYSNEISLKRMLTFWKGFDEREFLRTLYGDYLSAIEAMFEDLLRAHYDEQKEIERQANLAEQRRIAEQKRLAEERRLEKERLAEEKRIAEEKQKMVNHLIDMILKTPSKEILTVEDFGLSDKDFYFYLYPDKRQSIWSTRDDNFRLGKSPENYVEQ